jgi:hypothetical protein
MNNVQFQKSHGNWGNRVGILVNDQKHWLTMPVIRSYHGIRRIDEIMIDNSKPWQDHMLKSIQRSYAKKPHFKVIFPILEKIIAYKTDFLSDYNIHSIYAILKLLDLGVSKIILGSSLNVQGQATDLLISMVKSVGGTAYLCGGGAGGYQEDQLFAVAGIDLIYQNFNHPVYLQKNAKEFIPGLSIIDALMNVGIDGVKVFFVR